MKTDWFTQARFGLFIHWGLYAVPGKGEWTRFNDDWNVAEYEANIRRFNPVNFHPEEWAELAWNAGMRYVVFTTKHHDGFCMYDSHYTDFKVTNTPYGKDITRELVDAFRKRGLRIGFYHSLVDWRHPDFIPDEEHPDWKNGQRDFSSRNRENYQKYLFNQIEQLMTQYGKIDLLFFDYTSKYKTSEEWNCGALLEMIYRHQPEILVNDRLSFDKKTFPGDYFTPEICVPTTPPAGVWETCATMNDHWGYCCGDENYKSLDALTCGLAGCVSRNGNLLLNVGPDETGRFPAGAAARLKELSDWMKTNEEAIHGTGKSEFMPPYGCVYTQRENNLYLYLIQIPVGDMILPQLRDKVKKITLLRDGSEVPMVMHWGFELLKNDELRIRPSNVFPGDILKIELKNDFLNV